jgi:hypothetical protein
MVANWPTPTVAEGGKIGNQANYGQKALSNHPEMVGVPTREKSEKGDSQAAQMNNNNPGKPLEQSETKKLSPLWVAQLMGLPTALWCIPVEWILSDYSETE